MDINSKRSFILLGHAQSGKTSLSESILHVCAMSPRKGSVVEGTTVSDYNWDEIEHKNSINASLLHADFEGIRMQIIDSPGYADFYGEVLGGIRAVDNAVVVVDAVAGIGAGTEKAWELLEEEKLPRIIFVSKMDKEDVDKARIMQAIRERLSNKAVVIEESRPEELAELIADSDDSLLEKYLSEGTLSAAEISGAMGKAVVNCNIFPVIFGSSVTDKGVKELLTAISKYFANPAQRKDYGLQEGKLESSENAPFAGFVFKNVIDPYVGQLSLMRVFSGKLAANTSFYNVTQKSVERFGQLLLLQGKEQRNMEQASCGDIVAIPKLKATQTGDSISEQTHPLLFKPIVFPEAMMSASVKPRSRNDEEKISPALAKLAAEDHTFKVIHDPETKELVIAGLGDVHLSVMVARLKKRFNVEVDLGAPKVPYKETITHSARVQHKHKKQSGGRGQYGDVWLELSPLEHGKGFEFVDKIVGGAIPRNFIPSVEKGVRNAMAEGALAGYPVVDVRVTVFDGSYHDVDSSDMAFQIAGGMAFKKGVHEAGPVLLEPIMDVEITIPEEYLGQISGDLNQRRGRVHGMEAKSNKQIVKAQVPLAEMFTYVNDLRSMTQGKGSFVMKVAHYEQVPAKNAAPVIAKYQAQHKEKQE